MFHAARWTDAFFAALGENADEALLFLKAVVPQVKKIHGAFFGHGASARLEKMLTESAASTGVTANFPEAEYAVHFICLLVERNYFKHIDRLLERIGQKLDHQKGILDVIVESASPLGSTLEEELAHNIKEKTSSLGIRISSRVKPELLGGYLLRIGSFYVDASLKGQLEKMRADLFQAAKSAEDGGT